MISETVFSTHENFAADTRRNLRSEYIAAMVRCNRNHGLFFDKTKHLIQQRYYYYQKYRQHNAPSDSSCVGSSGGGGGGSGSGSSGGGSGGGGSGTSRGATAAAAAAAADADALHAWDAAIMVDDVRRHSTESNNFTLMQNATWRQAGNPARYDPNRSYNARLHYIWEENSRSAMLAAGLRGARPMRATVRTRPSTRPLRFSCAAAEPAFFRCKN